MHKNILQITANSIGYGSFFHSINLEDLPKKTIFFSDKFKLFYAGRYAMKFVFEQLMSIIDIKNIWLPNYYCPFVKNWLESEFSNLKYYKIDPFDPNSIVDWTLFNPNTDAILLNNYWGLKKMKLPDGERPIVIEDHSHGWLTEAAINSEADYCIASLRKTVPLPLGGIAWIPRASKINIELFNIDTPFANKNRNPMVKAWDTIMEAMQEKSRYFNVTDEKTYLKTYVNGEEMLRKNFEIYAMIEKHENLLKEMIFRDFNSIKKNHVSFAKSILKKTNLFVVLDAEIGTPFGLLLAFKELNTLKNIKTFLIENSIFPAELWPENEIDQEYKYLLNIHVDFRYVTNDIQYMVKKINHWISQAKE